MLLCSAQLPTHSAVHLQTLKLSGTFPMEVKSRIMVVFHTTELGVLILGQCCSTATLRVPQQGSSAVTYLMPVQTYRACLWGYMTATLVSRRRWCKFYYSRNQCPLPCLFNSLSHAPAYHSHRMRPLYIQMLTIMQYYDIQCLIQATLILTFIVHVLVTRCVTITTLASCAYRISSKNLASLIIWHPFTQLMGKIVSNFGKGIPKYFGFNL